MDFQNSFVFEGQITKRSPAADEKGINSFEVGQRIGEAALPFYLGTRGDQAGMFNLVPPVGASVRIKGSLKNKQKAGGKDGKTVVSSVGVTIVSVERIGEGSLADPFAGEHGADAPSTVGGGMFNRGRRDKSAAA